MGGRPRSSSRSSPWSWGWPSSPVHRRYPARGRREHHAAAGRPGRDEHPAGGCHGSQGPHLRGARRERGHHVGDRGAGRERGHDHGARGIPDLLLPQDGDKAWVWIFQAASDQKRERITDAGDDALWRVGGYLRGTTILSAIIAITDYVFMLVLGVPLAAPLALLVFLSGYIPYFGGIVTTALILLVTYASLGVGPVIAMLVLIGIRNVILGYGIRPAIYGRTVSIHPALVLVALPAGFELAGVVGLFAAVPVAAIILAVANATVVDPRPRSSPGAARARPGLDRPGGPVELAAPRRRGPRRAVRGHLRGHAAGADPRAAGDDPRRDARPARERPEATGLVPGQGRRGRDRRRVPRRSSASWPSR